MKEPCCEANSYGLFCMCSAYRGLKDRIEEDEGLGDYEYDRQREREDDENDTV